MSIGYPTRPRSLLVRPASALPAGAVMAAAARSHGITSQVVNKAGLTPAEKTAAVTKVRSLRARSLRGRSCQPPGQSRAGGSGDRRTQPAACRSGMARDRYGGPLALAAHGHPVAPRVKELRGPVDVDRNLHDSVPTGGRRPLRIGEQTYRRTRRLHPRRLQRQIRPPLEAPTASSAAARRRANAGPRQLNRGDVKPHSR